MSKKRDVGRCNTCGTPLVDAAPVEIFCPNDECPEGLLNKRVPWVEIDPPTITAEAHQAALREAIQAEKEGAASICDQWASEEDRAIEIRNTAAWLATAIRSRK